jgi:hypothetical protein
MEMLDCGHPESPHSEITRGYGTMNGGKKFCYDCCHKMDLESMKNNNQHFAYLSIRKDNRYDGKIVNWPGFTLARVTNYWFRNNNFCARWNFSKGYIVWFHAIDDNGVKWYGSSPGDGMYCRMRKFKNQ